MGHLGSDTGDMGLFALRLIRVLAIFLVIRLSRYVVLIHAKRSCLYDTCKKNVFSSKYMIKPLTSPGMTTHS